MRKNDFVIIMAGGIGSRFWPMSRSNYPKQFHDVLGTGKSLIRMTYERFLNTIPAENIYVVTNKNYHQLVKENIPEMEDDQILLEPVGRNTAPCVAYAASKIQKLNSRATIFVAPSDHLILNEQKYQENLALALDTAQKEPVIVTLGIKPTRPDTGYGYIQYIDEESAEGYHKVKTFTEKPDLDMARSFLRSGDFLWNSGMFVFSVKTILREFQAHLPDMFELFTGITSAFYTSDEEAEIEKVYAKCLNVSMDYGIMEKAENVFVIPSSFGWSDLGTWGSMYEHMEKDYHENAIQGNVMEYHSSNNVVKITDPQKLVVLYGLDDYIVVDTQDVLMICRKEDEQSIREMVKEVRQNQGEKYI